MPALCIVQVDSPRVASLGRQIESTRKLNMLISRPGIEPSTIISSSFITDATVRYSGYLFDSAGVSAPADVRCWSQGFLVVVFSKKRNKHFI